MYKSIIIIICSTFVFCANIRSQSQSSFVLTADTPWIISENQPEAVERALADVQKDWYKVFGQRPLVIRALEGDWSDGALYFGLEGNWRTDLVKANIDGTESFTLELGRDSKGRHAFVGTGNDIRGAIYAIYTFAEQILGVDPWYYWTDNEPATRSSIEIAEGYSKQWSNPTFLYRGWFINDEDQLSYAHPDPLRENIISMEMYDKVYETILRLKGNMVDPGTYIMPDERCQELASRRGLIINMHHINLLGLNTYRWPKGLPYSYNKHPEIFEKLWQECIDVHKDYEVVWTVGYRGKNDRPFWAEEPSLNTPKAQGEVISRAMAKQVELIRKSRPNDHIIANMWMEGATLYHAGHIKIPEGVVLVWPDNGAGIIRDNGRVKAGNGVYYHTAMIDRYSNQLTEMVNPNRARREMGRFVDAKATAFFMLNVSDVRSVPLTTDYLMKFAWDASSYMSRDPKSNMDDHIMEWASSQYGAKFAKMVAPIYDRYFDIAYMRDGSFRGEASLFYRIYGIYRSVNDLVEKGDSLPQRALKEINALNTQAIDNVDYIKVLLNKAIKLSSKVPATRSDFYTGHLITQLRIHYYALLLNRGYCSSLLAYQSGDSAAAIKWAEMGLKAIKTLYALTHDAEYGKWAGWYGGNSFIYMEQSADVVKSLLAALKGEPALPIRPFRGYGDIYKYQEKHLHNFPLLYDSKK